MGIGATMTAIPLTQRDFILLKKDGKNPARVINQALERRQCWLQTNRCLDKHCYQELES